MPAEARPGWSSSHALVSATANASVSGRALSQGRLWRGGDMGKRRGQGGVGLVYSVFLTALLTGCPGGDEASSVVGTWQGRTSQGKNISFVVALDETITTVTVGAHITGNACTFDDDALRASTS